MKILVTGDREWNGHISIGEALLTVLKENDLQPEDVTIIHGNCRGADLTADMVAKVFGMKTDPYPAHWSHTDKCPPDCKRMQGKPAGAIRNKQMLDENPDIDLALAFHHNLAKSKGTKDMVERLKKAGIKYRNITK